MFSKVRIETRRAALCGASPRVTETLICRDRDVVAVLPEGDPLRYLLELPLDELLSLKEYLAPVLERQPRARVVFEAVVEYRERKTP